MSGCPECNERSNINTLKEEDYGGGEYMIRFNCCTCGCEWVERLEIEIELHGREYVRGIRFICPK